MSLIDAILTVVILAELSSIQDLLEKILRVIE